MSAAADCPRSISALSRRMPVAVDAVAVERGLVDRELLHSGQGARGLQGDDSAGAESEQLRRAGRGHDRVEVLDVAGDGVVGGVRARADPAAASFGGDDCERGGQGKGEVSVCMDVSHRALHQDDAWSGALAEVADRGAVPRRDVLSDDAVIHGVSMASTTTLAAPTLPPRRSMNRPTDAGASQVGAMDVLSANVLGSFSASSGSALAPGCGASRFGRRSAAGRGSVSGRPTWSVVGEPTEQECPDDESAAYPKGTPRAESNAIVDRPMGP